MTSWDREIVDEPIPPGLVRFTSNSLPNKNGIDEIDFTFLMRSTIGNLCACIIIYNYIYIYAYASLTPYLYQSLS